MTMAVLFDLDRTLVDVQSTTDYGAALRDVEALLGRWEDPPVPPTGWDGPTRRAMGVLVGLAGDARWQAVSDLVEAHELAAATRSTAMPGLAEALATTAGVPRAVVTLMGPAAARAALQHHDIPIDVVVGRRPDLAVKPAPDQLLAACQALQVAPGDAAMVGDSTWDARAATAAGCRFVGVPFTDDEFPPTVTTAPTVADAVRHVMASAGS